MTPDALDARERDRTEEDRRRQEARECLAAVVADPASPWYRIMRDRRRP